MANQFLHFITAFVGVGIGMIGMNVLMGSIFGRQQPQAPPPPPQQRTGDAYDQLAQDLNKK